MIALNAFDDVVPQVKVTKVIETGQSVEARYLVEAQDLKQIPRGEDGGGNVSLLSDGSTHRLKITVWRVLAIDEGEKRERERSVRFSESATLSNLRWKGVPTAVHTVDPQNGSVSQV